MLCILCWVLSRIIHALDPALYCHAVSAEFLLFYPFFSADYTSLCIPMGQQQGFTTGSFGSVQPVSGFTKGYIRGFLYKAGSPAGV